MTFSISDYLGESLEKPEGAECSIYEFEGVTMDNQNAISEDVLLENAGEIKFRVRFSETDKMGITWHGNYFSWFEMGRTELLRSAGLSYRDLEESGTMFAVVSAECSYKHPALYDDILTLKTRIVKITPIRIEHEYRLFRGSLLLAIGKTVLASVDREGKIKPIPDSIVALFGRSGESAG